MSKILLREYYALCDGGICQDLLTEARKSRSRQWSNVSNGNASMWRHVKWKYAEIPHADSRA